MSNAQLKVAANPPTAAAPKKDTVVSLIERMKPQMALALPKHLNADRLARIVLTEIRRVPKLAECIPDSLLGAVMTCSQLGLEPGNSLGHAYLLPFEKRAKVGGQWQTVGVECQLIIGYRGMIDLARRSGQIVSLSARSVFENDVFDYSYGLDETLVHQPARGERGNLTFVYAVAKLKDGGTQFEVMTRSDVEKVRAQSKAKDSGPWITHFEEMAKKTAIRRLFKYLPVSVEMQRAVTLDEQGEAGIQQDHNIIDGAASEVAGTDSQISYDDPKLTYAQFVEQLQMAADESVLGLIMDEARDQLPPNQVEELAAVYERRAVELKA